VTNKQSEERLDGASMPPRPPRKTFLRRLTGPNSDRDIRRTRPRGRNPFVRRLDGMYGVFFVMGV